MKCEFKRSFKLGSSTFSFSLSKFTMVTFQGFWCLSLGLLQDVSVPLKSYVCIERMIVQWVSGPLLLPGSHCHRYALDACALALTVLNQEVKMVMAASVHYAQRSYTKDFCRYRASENEGPQEGDVLKHNCNQNSAITYAYINFILHGRLIL